MFALAVLFVGFYSLLAYCDLIRPEPAGFVLGFDRSSMIVTAVAPASPAAVAGLQVGDRVLTASARPMRSRLDWLSVEMNLRVGQPVRLEVTRDSERHVVALVLRGASASYWATPAGVTLLSSRVVQFVTLALAIVIAFRRPFDPPALIGSWLLASLAIYSIVLPYQIAAIWRTLPAIAGYALWIAFASSLATPAILFTFFASVPRPVLRRRVAWLVAWVPMVVVVLVELQFVWRVVYHPDQAEAFVDWTRGRVAAAAGYTIAVLAILVIGYRRLTDVTERRRVRVLVVGSSMGLVSALAVVGGYWRQSGVSLEHSVFVSPAAAVGSILALAVPLSFAYAILRHRLFDVRLLVRQGLQYALARRVLVSIVPVSLAVFLIDLWINRDVPVVEILGARGWLYAVLAGLALVARARRNQWLDALDRRFFRERLNVQRLLRAIGEDVRAETDLDAVAPRVVAQIEAALHAEFVALLRKPRRQLRYAVVARAPAATTDLEPLSSESKAVGLLQWLWKPLQLPADAGAWPARQLPPAEVESMRRAHIELLVPIQIGTGAADALFALGPKRSEEPYSAEDEDLLMAIGSSLAPLVGSVGASLSGREAFDECPTCGVCFEAGGGRCPDDSSVLTLVSSPRVLGGRYRLDRRIGRGGMGTVYEAFDAALDRRVAAKLLREDVLGSGAAERFQSEARLAAALAHPNVVTVHDTGVTASGRAYFIMELLEGVTLRDELRREGRLGRERVQLIVRGVCAAVEAAHRRRMIHRDLKPENVFLSRSDEGDIPKVLDFGLAKALEASGGVTLTIPGLVAGTPQYMAPEHLAGEDPSPDWDLWALAVMAFEMITGTLPLRSGGGASGRLSDDLPAGLGRLFSRALSPNPIDRPTSAREFADELDRELECRAASS
jgi:hypothetical protein